MMAEATIMTMMMMMMMMTEATIMTMMFPLSSYGNAIHCDASVAPYSEPPARRLQCTNNNIRIQIYSDLFLAALM